MPAVQPDPGRYRRRGSQFGSDSEVSDVIYYVQNEDWVGEDYNGAIVQGLFIPPMDATDMDFSPGGVTANGGGAPTQSWALLE